MSYLNQHALGKLLQGAIHVTQATEFRVRVEFAGYQAEPFFKVKLYHVNDCIKFEHWLESPDVHSDNFEAFEELSIQIWALIHSAPDENYWRTVNTAD